MTRIGVGAITGSCLLAESASAQDRPSCSQSGQDLAGLFLQSRFFQLQLDVLNGDSGLFVEVRYALRLPEPHPVVRLDLVSRDPQQPASDRRLAAKRAKLLERYQKDIVDALNHLSRGCATARAVPEPRKRAAQDHPVDQMSD